MSSPRSDGFGRVWWGILGWLWRIWWARSWKRRPPSDAQEDQVISHVLRPRYRLSHVVAVAFAAPRSPVSVVASSTAVLWPRTDASSAGDSARTAKLDKVGPSTKIYWKTFFPKQSISFFCQIRILMRVVLRLWAVSMGRWRWCRRAGKVTRPSWPRRATSTCGEEDVRDNSDAEINLRASRPIVPLLNSSPTSRSARYLISQTNLDVSLDFWKLLENSYDYSISDLFNWKFCLFLTWIECCYLLLVERNQAILNFHFIVALIILLSRSCRYWSGIYLLDVFVDTHVLNLSSCRCVRCLSGKTTLPRFAGDARRNSLH